MHVFFLSWNCASEVDTEIYLELRASVILVPITTT